jgi:hypothetical protein
MVKQVVYRSWAVSACTPDFSKPLDGIGEDVRDRPFTKRHAIACGSRQRGAGNRAESACVKALALCVADPEVPF